MKLLRVLTGSHAGARLALADGDWCIAAPVADAPAQVASAITLEDWQGTPVLLRLAAGAVHVQDSSGQWVMWPDLTAQRFGDVVLCVGGDDVEWPADMLLLAPLVRYAEPVPQMVPASASPSSMRTIVGRRGWRWRGAAVALASAGTLALVIASPSQIPHDAPSERLPIATSAGILASHTADRVRMALAAAHVTGLDVAIDGFQVKVTGMLDSPQDDARARIALLPFRNAVASDWQLMPELLDTLRSALHGQGVVVRYAGDGHYVVEGTTTRPALVRDMAARLAQDLAPGVRSVQVDVTPPATRSRPATRLEAGETRYAIQPDGTKTFGP